MYSFDGVLSDTSKDLKFISPLIWNLISKEFYCLYWLLAILNIGQGDIIEVKSLYSLWTRPIISNEIIEWGTNFWNLFRW